MILRIIWQGALLLLLAVGAAWATYRWHPERPELYLISELAGPDEITVSDAIAMEKAQGVLWLDARRREQFDKGHIPGAMLLNIYEWEELMMPVVNALSDGPRRTMIIYCDAQKCSSSRELREKIINFGLGEFDIRLLHGGWPAWKAAAGAK